ncbi:MAG: hypothetical protein GWN84_12800, partial [Gammaproteobacteria bacterium]|nr:hypothetical protein [Gammaproteobacteria bacterium]NIR30164.1 hypothetical protein [Gammaproteobacteria bacterium]NIU05064.1 hypothetical protein [Gammaproteobacteria bacterium]NIV51914.1 hypothetical protein [Gammaproteobacteria bacterium]NIX86337.1 hypothetical protein [Gammaproteobacteria bacterium]
MPGTLRGSTPSRTPRNKKRRPATAAFAFREHVARELGLLVARVRVLAKRESRVRGIEADEFLELAHAAGVQAPRAGTYARLVQGSARIVTVRSRTA